MDKLSMQTPDLAASKFAKLSELFPNIVTETIDAEGRVVRAVDPEVLAQEINAHVLSGKEERYQFTWPDKRKSVVLSNAPIRAALRPCREESVNFDTTENLYIEGDNLDVLKLLRETYLNRVKMIYIDPPYNTGNDFIYEDDFAVDAGEFLARDYQYDEDGNRMVRNLDSNGRFHTDWLNMIYPRLRLARDLLREDGVIFISIDDNEVENLKKVCNEVFGEQNLVGLVIWERAFAPKNDAKYFSASHDFILVYAKKIDEYQIGKMDRTGEANARYKNLDNDPRGVWASDNLTVKTYSSEYDYEIKTPAGRVIRPADGRCWFTNKKRMQELIDDNRVWFGEDGNNMPRLKRFLSDVQQGMVPITIWRHNEVGHNQEGRQELKKLFDDKGYFDGPKPVRLLQKILKVANTTKDSIILDFFSGSATTAHAVMQLNAEDGGHRKFIMVQIPEACDETSEAYKAGYQTICDIGKERIRRAGRKIVEESPIDRAGLDIGFRVLKLDSSNMKDVYYTPEEYAQMSFAIEAFEDNIKPGRTEEDLLFQVMLDLGIPLSASIRQEGKLWLVDDGYLTACFTRVDTDLISKIAKTQPMYAVFRDSCFESDSDMVNFEQIFATYSPTTNRRVL